MIIKENEKIPLDLIRNKNYTVSLGIKTSYPVESSISLFSESLYFKFYRLFSEEEKEFLEENWYGTDWHMLQRIDSTKEQLLLLKAEWSITAMWTRMATSNICWKWKPVALNV